MGGAAFPLCIEFFYRFFGLSGDLRLVRTSSIPVNASVTKEWSHGRQMQHSPVTAAGICPSYSQAHIPDPRVKQFHREEKQRLKVHQNVSRVATQADSRLLVKKMPTVISTIRM